MKRRLLVPVVLSLALGACAALLWPAPRSYVLRVRLVVGISAGGPGLWFPAFTLIPTHSLKGRLYESLVLRWPSPQRQVDALLEDPDFLAELRHDPRCAALVPDEAPDALPTDWLSSRASLIIKGATTEERHGMPPDPYLELSLKGRDPDGLRAAAPAVVSALAPQLPACRGIGLCWTGPQGCGTVDTAAPRRRLALSLSCLALAAVAGVRAWRLAFGRRAAKGDVASHRDPPGPVPAPCGAQDFPPPEITAGEPTTQPIAHAAPSS
jgi:hypothetical protein